MGYQLWVSPMTGLRRRGTRLIELHNVLGSRITTGAIYELVQSCPADAPAVDMLYELEKRDFDIAGVRKDQAGHIVGYVERASLHTGLVKDHVQTICEKDVIADSLPLLSLLKELKDRSWLFVSVNGMVEGIVTLADLNKPVVRVFLFGLVSLLEMHLTFWINEEYKEDSWRTVLKQNRIDIALQIQEQRGDSNIMDCLQFSDRRDLVVASGRIRQVFGGASKTSLSRRLRGVEKLRNNLAHSQYSLAPGGSWAETLDLVEWLDDLVQESDEQVENKASDSARDFVNLMW